MGRCATCRASTQNFCFVHQEFVCSTCLIHHPSGLHATCALGTYRDFVQDSSYPPIPVCVSCNQPFHTPSDAVRRLCLHLECVACINNPARKPDIKCAKCTLPLLPPDAPPSALQEAIRARFVPSPIHISLQPDLTATAPSPYMKPDAKTPMRALPTSPVAATPSPPPITSASPYDLHAHMPASHTISTTDLRAVAMPSQPGVQTVPHSRPPPQIVPFRVAGSGYSLGHGGAQKQKHARRDSGDWLPTTTSATSCMGASSASPFATPTVSGLVAGFVATLIAVVEPWARRVAAAAPQIRARTEHAFERMARATRRIGKEAARQVRAARKSPGQSLRARRGAVSAVFVACVVLVLVLSSGSEETRVAGAGSQRAHKRAPAAAADALPLAGSQASSRRGGGRVAVRPQMVDGAAEEGAAAEGGELEVVRLPHVHVGRAFNGRAG